MTCPTCYRSAGLRYHRAALAGARRLRKSLLRSPRTPRVGVFARTYAAGQSRALAAAALADAAEIRRTLATIRSARHV